MPIPVSGYLSGYLSETCEGYGHVACLSEDNQLVKKTVGSRWSEGAWEQTKRNSVSYVGEGVFTCCRSCYWQRVYVGAGFCI